MRSLLSRRLLVAIFAVIALGSSFPLAVCAVYLVAAHTELARLNDEFGADATMDQDSMSLANRAKSAELLRRVRDSNRAAVQQSAATSQLAAARPVP